MEKISRNQENFIIMTVIYDEIADQVASREHNFRDVDEIITDKKMEIDKITDQADKDQDKEARNQGVFPVTRSFLRSLGPVCFSRRSFQHGGFPSLWLSVSLLFVIFQFLHPLLLSGYTVPE